MADNSSVSASSVRDSFAFRQGDVDTMLLMRKSLTKEEMKSIMMRVKDKRVHSFRGKMDSVRFQFLKNDVDR